MIPETVEVSGRIKQAERARILNPLIRESFEDANARRESLTIQRPASVEIEWEHKSRAEIETEAGKHADLANQLAFFDKAAKPLKPCPVRFWVAWIDQSGVGRKHECDDWETSSAYNRFEREYGHERAISFLKQKYETEYFDAGLVLAFSTHSRRNVEHGPDNQWLLVGLVRLDEDLQGDFFL